VWIGVCSDTEIGHAGPVAELASSGDGILPRGPMHGHLQEILANKYATNIITFLINAALKKNFMPLAVFV